ncbi:Zn(II)2Cys6 transcription factor KNAG_0M00130 [Huiozyma naganishii CBS 8797]|uniref:Zn(2)-C6 fungal-type domain-containing protein n=1 Tax=Huiozyma naganishii (strain ATCC MYA-139 / BCRC 22969 / CBS 8797 / KCTC 17520 / NBRC 10181 / NCYC 3082 / Yp74L-3) TaxID=1071383 RepID=J7SB95_HUIN7|nr:hypothetical protein KNAG_0M00130 [Kazachstania naganishii CBS 8797]CCK72866.1 hypothetical protein KNAG_0M00130 [Kazachstania naganishii CBS 8797]
MKSTKIARSRTGCKNCKRLKIKCDENRPRCQNCMRRNNVNCDYSIVLRWGCDSNGGIKKKHFLPTMASKTTPRTQQQILYELGNDSNDGGTENKYSLANDLGAASPTLSQVLGEQEQRRDIQPLDNEFSIEVGNQQREAITHFGESPGILDLILKDNEPITQTTFLSDINLSTLHLPSPLPSILVNSPYYMELFDFYMRETAHLFVPTPSAVNTNNPFRFLLPRMAMNCQPLLYLLLAFGANHKSKKMRQLLTNSTPNPPFYEIGTSSSEESDGRMHESSSNSSTSSTGMFTNIERLDQQVDDYNLPKPDRSSSLTYFKGSTSRYSSIGAIPNCKRASTSDTLLHKAFKTLLKCLKNESERSSNDTVAAIMMLAAFDIFFSDKQATWRRHLDGARKLIMENLRSGKYNKLDELNNETDPGVFINKWFLYVDIIGSLSSIEKCLPLSAVPSHEFLVSQIQYYEKNPSQLQSKIVEMNDIDYNSGMDPKNLLLLGKVSRLINNRNELHDAGYISIQRVEATLELDHEINKNAILSDEKRDEVLHCYYKNEIPQQLKEKYEVYKILRVTNLIYALSGSLQLKRRVLNISNNSTIITDLLIKISKLIRDNIPMCSSTTTCVIFCLFCCGCELIEKSLWQYRSIYLDRIEAMSNIGVSSALMAKFIMQKCWRDKKAWWTVLEEDKLNITFAI